MKESRRSSQISRIRKLSFTTKVASYPSASHVTFILTLPVLSEWAAEKGMVRILALEYILSAQHNLQRTFLSVTKGTSEPAKFLEM